MVVQLKIGHGLMTTISLPRVDGYAAGPRRIDGLQDFIVHVWQMTSPTNMAMLSQLSFLGYDVELEMDHKYIIVVAEGDEAKTVHVISSETHKVINTLSCGLSLSFKDASMQYNDGLMLTAELAGIKVVDVATGQCLSWIRLATTRYDAMRFNSKYIVTIEKRTKTVVVFDLQSVLDPRKDIDKVILCTFQWPVKEIRKIRLFQMDEFCLVGCGRSQSPGQKAHLHLLDFF